MDTFEIIQVPGAIFALLVLPFAIITMAILCLLTLIAGGIMRLGQD
jgi:hypothetical protein